MREMQGVEIPADQFEAGDWGPHVEQLLRLPRGSTAGPNGAEEAAGYISAMVSAAVTG
jgi:hypothetical protein